MDLCYTEDGQRVLVNPGVALVFVGPDSGGGVTVARVMHAQTCGAGPVAVDQDGARRVLSDGPWKSKEERRRELADRQSEPARKPKGKK